MLAVLPAMTALGGVVLRLERAKSTVAPDIGQYFTSPNTWYLKTGQDDGLKYFYRNRLDNHLPKADLTEASLEEMIEQIHRETMTRGQAFAVVRPDRLIVSPKQYADWLRWKDRERYRNVWEWLWNRLMPA